MTEFKTPRPVPVFYSANSVSFSTKKERQTPYNRCRSSKPLAKTAPPISRLFPHRYWLAQKPKPISFKSQLSDSFLSYRYYDESNHESYFEQCFAVECKIGEGSFGEVFKVRSKEDGRIYAVKKSIETFRSATDRMQKLSEVQKHEQLPKHPNLVQFVKAWEERGCLYIQTELCKTNLRSYSESYHDLPQSVIWNYLVDLLLAIKHLHDHDLIHMDVKPDNIFISDDGICKLGDFGLVTDLKRRNYDDVQEGDSKYLAPELLQGKVGKHVDIFSLGVTFLEVACDLDLPTHGEPWQMLRHGVLPEDLMIHLTNDLRTVIRLMMNPNYSLRPSACELLQLKSVRSLAKYRQIFCAYRKIVNAVNNFIVLFWLYALCFAKVSLMKPINYWRFLLRYKTRPSSLMVNGTSSVSSLTGIKRKHVVLTPENDISSPLRIARLNFSDVTDSLEDDVLHDLSAIENPDVSKLEENERDGFSTELPDLSHHESSPDVNSNSFFSRFKYDHARPWNSTPAHNNHKLRRRIPLVEKKGLNFTSSPLVFGNAMINESSSCLDVNTNPFTTPDMEFPKVSPDGLGKISLPPKKLFRDFNDGTSSEDDDS